MTQQVIYLLFAVGEPLNFVRFLHLRAFALV